MDQNPFDSVSHLLTRVPSRRDVLRSLAGAGLGLGALRLPEVVAAKNDHRKHKKRNKDERKSKHKKAVQVAPQPNEFGCLSVGQPCGGDSTLCCSSICEGAAPKKGKRDTRVCAAHGQGTCDQTAPGICEAKDPNQVLCNDSTGACFTTTAGSNFCAELTGEHSGCADCRRDADCEALGFPPGTACAIVSGRNCVSPCQGKLACMAPSSAAVPAK